MSETNIISIDKRDKISNETTKTSKLLEFTMTYKYIFIFIIVALFLVLLYFALFKKSNTKTKKNKKKKDKDDASDTDSDTTEEFKQDVERSDPSDEYDLENDIKKLLKKQESYLEKINKFY